MQNDCSSIYGDVVLMSFTRCNSMHKWVMFGTFIVAGIRHMEHLEGMMNQLPQNNGGVGQQYDLAVEVGHSWP